MSVWVVGLFQIGYYCSVFALAVWVIGVAVHRFMGISAMGFYRIASTFLGGAIVAFLVALTLAKFGI